MRQHVLLALQLCDVALDDGRVASRATPLAEFARVYAFLYCRLLATRSESQGPWTLREAPFAICSRCLAQLLPPASAAVAERLTAAAGLVASDAFRVHFPDEVRRQAVVKKMPVLDSANPFDCLRFVDDEQA